MIYMLTNVLLTKNCSFFVYENFVGRKTVVYDLCYTIVWYFGMHDICDCMLSHKAEDENHTTP